MMFDIQGNILDTKIKKKREIDPCIVTYFYELNFPVLFLAGWQYVL